MKAHDLFEGTMRDGKREVTDIGIVASALRFAFRVELVLLQPSVSKTFSIVSSRAFPRDLRCNGIMLRLSLENLYV